MELERLQGSSGAAGLQTAEVLIADDDPSCLAALERAFRIQGLRTISCRDGRDAWAAIRGNPYISLVVLNWMLPQLDGHSICRLLRKHRPAVASVLMVGQSFLREAWTALDLQTRYVLTKPFPKSGLDRTVASIVLDAFRRC
jgi:DNA-binding response OmpR family regulator